MKFFTVFKALTAREKVVVVILFSVLMALHLNYTPWLVSAENLALEKYDLRNEPAPEWARSFSINHGAAIYYEDDLPKFHPLKRAIIYTIAFFSWLGIVLVSYRGYRRSG